MNGTPTKAVASDRRSIPAAWWLIIAGSVILIGGISYGLLVSCIGLQSTFDCIDAEPAPTPGELESGVHSVHTSLAGGLVVAFVGGALLCFGLVVLLRRRSAESPESGDWDATSDPRT